MITSEVTSRMWGCCFSELSKWTKYSLSHHAWKLV